MLGGRSRCPRSRCCRSRSLWPGLAAFVIFEPDMLPILGRDPDYPALIYASGHSKNGILLAPATAEAIAALILGETPAIDLSPFRLGRFAEAANL